ncbi:MAG: cytochrome c1 [Pseudomonadota bacterium]
MRHFLAAVLALTSFSALASSGAAPFHFDADVDNQASLQRGARNYMAYCAGCHSLKHLRYNRMGRDLGIPEDLLKAHLMFTSDKVGDPILSSMSPADAEKWFGRAPPDLSLVSRARGESWVYSYLLTFYADPSKVNGVNNLMLPGLSMPHVLDSLQGTQVLLKEEGDSHGGHGKPKFELVKKGSMTPEQYKDFVGDLTNFLAYAAEPGRSARVALGLKVMLYLFVLLVLTYLLKKEFWKDVH